MKKQTAKISAWLLGLLLFSPLPAQAQKIINPRSLESYSITEFFQQLDRAKVIYLGETHNSPADHQAQLAIIQDIHRRNGKVAIAMEMFQRPYQNVINNYLAGKITETELVTQSEYNKRWGFPWENYAPILRFAKDNKLPVLALNTPSEVTRKVARKGLESLTVGDREHIPPLPEIRTDNTEYRQMALNAFQQHQKDGFGSSSQFDNFFLAQVLWDETMAEKIAQFIKTNPDYKVIVLAGQGHIIYGYGIPSRVERRLNNKNLIQRLILLNPDKKLPSSPGKAIADFFWHSDANK